VPCSRKKLFASIPNLSTRPSRAILCRQVPLRAMLWIMSRTLFRLWAIPAGMWAAYIAGRALLFMMWPPADDHIATQAHIVATLQWAMEWALLPPAAFLAAACVISWVGRHLGANRGSAG